MHVIYRNSALNSVELREFILGVVVLIRSIFSRCHCVLKLKFILGFGPKVKDFTEDPFK
jgi:hypothetical protein